MTDRVRPADPALAARLDFVLELDRLKSVLRRTTLADGSRYENTAEHSWHLAMTAIVLAEHADEPVDLAHVVRLLLVHDVVEIDADDTFIYDLEGRATKAAREQAAAERIFGLLPDGAGDELHAWWREYEERSTPEGRFAYALDRLQPMLLNHASGGGSWREHGIRVDQVLAVNRPIASGSVGLWEHAQDLVADGLARGWLQPAAGEARDDAPGPPPVLATERLVLRWPRLADAEAAFAAWCADPEVTRFLTWDPHPDAASVRTTFLRPVLRSLGDGSEALWLLDHPEHGPIGSIAARPDGLHGVELGYALARDHWGQGLMAEAVRAVVAAHLGRDGVGRVWAYHEVDNPASGRVLEKAGLHHEGRLAGWLRHTDGRHVDCEVWAVTA